MRRKLPCWSCLWFEQPKHVRWFEQPKHVRCFEHPEHVLGTLEQLWVLRIIWGPQIRFWIGPCVQKCCVMIARSCVQYSATTYENSSSYGPQTYVERCNSIYTYIDIFLFIYIYIHKNYICVYMHSHYRPYCSGPHSLTSFCTSWSESCYVGVAFWSEQPKHVRWFEQPKNVRCFEHPEHVPGTLEHVPGT